MQINIKKQTSTVIPKTINTMNLIGQQLDAPYLRFTNQHELSPWFYEPRKWLYSAGFSIDHKI